MQSLGLLSLNERNIAYIKKYNPVKTVRLVDNKHKTKKFLENRGIPVPETYARIRSRQELAEFSLSRLPDTFVIKPNKGSKGEGIIIVRRTAAQIYSVSGEQMPAQRLQRAMIDILDGRFSLGYGPDTILIEEKLNPGSGFEDFCEYGLADIRIIAFNLVPVAAMVRVPTKQSEGKANLAMGGAAFGIEIGSGNIYTYYQKKVVHTTTFPDAVKHVKGMKMPYRDDILLYSSNIQYFVNMGYLALDWVITKTGPKILEINARAGNEIQNVSLVPLKKRLNKVADLAIESPEKAIEIAKSLFAKKTSLPQEKILYLTQHAKLSLPDEDIARDVVVKVDLSYEKNYCSAELYGMIQKGYRLRLPLSDISWSKRKFVLDEKLEDHEMVIGSDTASRYLIKPIRKIHDLFAVVNAERVRESELHVLTMLDRQIMKIARRTNLIVAVRPMNYLEELDRFVTRKGRYNPTFRYNFPTLQRLQGYEEELLSLQEQFFGDDSPLVSDIAPLFRDKIEELLLRLQLLRAYAQQDYAQIEKFNYMYFGDFSSSLLAKAREVINKPKNFDKSSLGEILSLPQQRIIIESYLRTEGITDYSIELTSQTVSRISFVKRGKKLIVKISTGSNAREKEIHAILAHEIDTHLRRSQNGYRSGRRILASGTAFYDAHEEGFAIYNAKQKHPVDYISTGMYEKYIRLAEGSHLSFVKYADYIVQTSPYKTLSIQKLFKSALRGKRGIIATGSSEQSIGFLKDKIYLDGSEIIENRIMQGGNVDDLYVGKIKVNDLQYIL